MINRERLFTHQEVAQGKQPHKDASPLGGYVLAALPQDLVDIKNGSLSYDELANRHGRIVEDASGAVEAIAERRDAAVAQLDLAFMMGAYLPDDNFGSCPPQILKLAKRQAERHQLAPHMDYELVIDVNSEEFERTGHMRTYLGGELGLSERDFYYGHSLSEQHIKDVAVGLNSLVTNPGIAESAIEETLEQTAAAMREFKLHMAKYAKLSRPAFATMRPYLASYPDGTRNASGAFMPSVQLAELALHAPSDEHQLYLDESMQYFPRDSRAIIEEWTQQSLNGVNILSMIESGILKLNERSKEVVQQLVDEFYTFRTTHLGITKKQIPEAFAGRVVPVGRKQLTDFGEPDILSVEGEVGTAGFDIVNVLGGATSRLARLRDRVDQATKHPIDTE